MKNLIDRLSRQSREVKSHAALLVAFIATILVALIWISTIPARIVQLKDTVVESGARENLAALNDAVRSEVQPQKEERVEDKTADLKNRVDTMLKSVGGDAKESSREEKKSTSTPRSVPPPVIIEVRKATTTASTSSSPTVGMPVQIETR